jgi:hypothetical protein
VTALSVSGFRTSKLNHFSEIATPMRKIVEIDCLLDPERLARLDLAVVDGGS